MPWSKTNCLTSFVSSCICYLQIVSFLLFNFKDINYLIKNISERLPCTKNAPVSNTLHNIYLLQFGMSNYQITDFYASCHLVNAGVRWINDSGQFDWDVGEWYRVEYTVSGSGGSGGVKGFLEQNVNLDFYRPYLAAIILSTHWDSTSQNYFFYLNEADNRWVRFPWDMDITWGYSRRKRPPSQGHNLHPWDGTPFNPEPQEFMVSALRSASGGAVTKLRRVRCSLRKLCQPAPNIGVP